MVIMVILKKYVQQILLFLPSSFNHGYSVYKAKFLRPERLDVQVIYYPMMSTGGQSYKKNLHMSDMFLERYYSVGVQLEEGQKTPRCVVQQFYSLISPI